MGVTREQIHEGGSVFWRVELHRPGQDATVRLLPAKILEVARGAARILVLENEKEVTVRFSHLEPDLDYLELCRQEWESKKRRPGRPPKYPKPDHQIVVTQRFIRPANDGALAVAQSEPAPQQLAIVPAYVPPPEPEPEPEAVKPQQDDFDALLDMAGSVFESLEGELRSCALERELLHERRREIEREIQANVEKQKSLESRRAAIRTLLG